MSFQSAVARTFRRRRTHVYCVGTAKSGTHSIADLFVDRVRAQHEAHSEAIIKRILEHASGKISDAELARYLRWRDRELKLEIDSSQLNVFFIEMLVKNFPKARFILTLRDPYSWLDSLVNHSLSDGISDGWVKMRDFRFRPDLHTHEPEEQALEERGLHTLDGYLSYWTFHNNRVLNAVPGSRLFVVKTNEITQRAEEIVSFAGFNRTNTDRDSTHSFKARQKYNVLDEVDQAFLQSKISKHCGELMDRFFPEATVADNIAGSRFG